MFYSLIILTICASIIAPRYGYTEEFYGIGDYEVQDLKSNEEIAVNGEIINVDRDSFMLDYGSHTITVETDNITRDAESLYIPGEYVKVKGRVEDEPAGQQVIRATRIIKYIKELD